MAIITISRLTGSGGREIATAVAEALKFQLIDRPAVEAIIDRQFPVRTEQLLRLKKDRKVFDDMMRSAIAEVAATRDVVVLGSGAQFLFGKVAGSLHVQVVAPLPYRIARVMRLAQIGKDSAERLIEERDQEKETFIRALYASNWRDPVHYDLVLNIDHFSNDMAVEIIVKAAQAKGIEATAVQLPPQLRENILTTKLDVAQMAELETVEDKLPEFA